MYKKMSTNKTFTALAKSHLYHLSKNWTFSWLQ